MLITAWGKQADVMDFLNDTRVHPALTRDVVVKRIKRGFIPEIALTKGVADEAKVGDTPQRRKARNEKAEYRCKMFLLAQEVRKRHAAGVEISDLMQRFEITRSQTEKFISGNEYYNIWWAGSNIPDEFKEIAAKIKVKEKKDENV
jgi:hypothetical protein